MKNNYSVVIPCTLNTIENFIKNYYILDLYIKPKSIIIIANHKVEYILKKTKFPVVFIDEDKLYKGMTYQTIKEKIKQQIGNEDAANCTGWYFQQFLKMAFCTVCSDENYLVWDSDTIPMKEVIMFNEKGKKYFDIKNEYHEPYFCTMNRLLPKLLKKNNYSFISEHMLFETNIMKELIVKIEDNLELEGTCFWEKIISAIRTEDILKSGFSEFETYGTYVEHFYVDKYTIRKWHSLRKGTIFYKNVTKEQLKYLSHKYDAVSFENHEKHKKLQKIFAHKCFQNLFVINLLEKL